MCAARSTDVAGPTSRVVTTSVCATPATDAEAGVPSSVATWPGTSAASLEATPSIFTVAVEVVYSAPSTNTLPKREIAPLATWPDVVVPPSV